jgi:hypothetical protein
VYCVNILSFFNQVCDVVLETLFEVFLQLCVGRVPTCSSCRLKSSVGGRSGNLVFVFLACRNFILSLILIVVIFCWVNLCAGEV